MRSTRKQGSLCTVLPYRYLSIAWGYGCRTTGSRAGARRYADRLPAWTATWKARQDAAGLEQAQLASAGHCFGAPLDLQLVEYHAIVPLDRAQSQEQALADLVIREPVGDQSQYF